MELTALSCTIWATKVETHPENSGFSFCIIRLRVWRVAGYCQDSWWGTSGTIDLFIAKYLNPPFLGRTGFYEARARVWGFYLSQHRLPRTWRSAQAKALTRTFRSYHQDDLGQAQIQRVRGKVQTEPRIWCYATSQFTCPHLSELPNSPSQPLFGPLTSFGLSLWCWLSC